MKYLVVLSLLLMSSFAYAGNGGERGGGHNRVDYGTVVVCHDYASDLAGKAVCNNVDGCDALELCKKLNEQSGISEKDEVPVSDGGNSDSAN